MILRCDRNGKNGNSPWMFDLGCIDAIKGDAGAEKVLGQHRSGNWVVLSDNLSDWGKIKEAWAEGRGKVIEIARKREPQTESSTS